MKRGKEALGAALSKVRRNKYRVSPPAERTVDGIVFASKREAGRYGHLKVAERAGLISALELQPRFPIEVNGTKICTYVADFRYSVNETGARVVEDVKGFATPMYKLKRKLVLAIHGVEVVEP